VMSRRATEVDKVGDVVIPAGAIVIISPYTVHRNTNYWENPEQFLPERFSAENKRQRHRYAYIPFGGGARLCIGYRFAEMESMLVLATLAQRFAPMPVATPHPIAMVTIRPKNGLPMYPNPR
ncbi:MAG: cytochrome P450, partial [Methyloceanibacter sp.]